jgi:hypothetical protein
MIITLLGVVIILQLLNLRWSKPAKPAIIPELHPIMEKVFRDCGLNGQQFHGDFDLIPTGKLGEFIYHSANALGKPIRTVRDVQKFLDK